MSFKNLLIFIFIVLAYHSFGQMHINNAKPKTDDKGQPVDAHDGRVMKFGNKYYWYGTAYGKTNGFTQANTYVVYSSPNMKNWHFEGELIPEKTKGVYYRPNVVYNAKTKKYVLWYNWNPKLWDGQFGVALADSPTGPFKVLNENVTVKNSKYGVGDLGVFVDTDQKAYISYCTITDHMVSVELLDENYTNSTLQSSEIVAKHCEAGAMFKKKDTYYLLTDYTCCFCTQGSGAQVFTSKNPLGPYIYRQNINRFPGELSAVLNNGVINENFYETISNKEYLEIEFEGKITLKNFDVYQFTGNRNGQCGEVDNPILHDAIVTTSIKLQYFYEGEWIDLQTFKTFKTENLSINKHTININKPIVAERIRIYPSNIADKQALLLTEISIKNANFRVFKCNGNLGKPIIAAQQTFVMPINNQLIWMGDLWGSASNGIKGHDYQYWSAPLQFYKNGLIKPLKWLDKVSF